jgi:hypothetical protein
MRLRQLFEAKTSEVAIIFGRFNPPHKGHRAAWEMASKSPVWYVGTNQSTVGPKDPLPYDVKVEAMKTVWPEVEGHIVAETSWLTLASKVYEQYPDATLLCLTDEDWVTKTIQQYNGKEGQHGFYNFKNITQKPTPRLSSATALRDAVSKGDRDAFTQAAGVDADTPVAGKPFFDLVAEYLLPYASAPKKVAKKKVPAPVEGIDIGREWMSDTELDQYVPDNLQQQWRELLGYDQNGNPSALWANMTGGYEPDVNDRQHRALMVKVANKWFAAKKIPNVKFFSVRDADDELEWLVQIGEQGVAEGSLKEFASDDSDREEDTLLKFARIWYNGDDDIQQKVERALDRQGWEIGEIESEEGGAFVVRSGDENGDTYIGFAPEDLTEDAAGVGIITKQNTTKDVNKGTLRKMMKGFKLI